MQYTLIETGDGSLSCLDAETGELCHNRAGAYTEALTHYVEPSGLLARARRGEPLRLLDACFGLGYNTLVFLNELLKDPPEQLSISVVGIENSPEILGYLPRIIESPMFDTLKSFNAPKEHNIYYRISQVFQDTKGLPVETTSIEEQKGKSKFESNGANSNSIIQVCEGPISLQIRTGDLRAEVQTLEPGFDAVFHDAFSPASMPELWSAELFAQYARLLKPDGVLLTYSTAAAVRGALMEAGLQVTKTPALGGKNGGTLAGFGDTGGEHLTEPEKAYIETKAGIPYRDPSLAGQKETVLEDRKREQALSQRPSGGSVRKIRLKI